MKKLFTLLTLALMTAQSVKADVVQWAVSDAPAVGTAFQVKNGSDEIIQVAFGAMNPTKTDAEATTYTTGDGKLDVTYSGTKYSFTKYATTSATNGSDSNELKADGTSEANYMAFVPKYNGVLVIVVQNNGGKKTFLYENGVEKAATLIGLGSESVAFNGKEDLKPLNGDKNYSGGISFPVKAGSTYTISVSGSKGRWEGFIYDYNTSGVVKPVVSFSEDKLNVLPEASVSEPTLSIEDLDGNDISGYFSATYSSDNENVAKVDASTGEISLVSNNEGTAVITAKLTSNDAEKYEDAEAKYTITVASEITYPYTWDFTTFETSGTWDKLADDTNNWGVKSETTYQSLVEMKGTIAAGGVTIPETKFIKFGTFGTNKIYINKNSLQLNGKTLTITIPDLTAGYYVSIDFENPSGSESRGFTLTNVNEKESGDAIKLAASTRETRTFTVKEDGNVSLTSTSGIRIYGISVTTEAPTVTVYTTNGYATFSSAAAVDFSESGAEVYTASVDGNNAVLTKVESGKVPANTGVIIKSESATVEGKCIYNASALEGNQLIAATKEVSEKGIYILVADGESVKFTTMTSGTLTAGKAYLPAATATTSEARELNLVVGNATGISEVNAAVKSAELYNLNGVRVSQPGKGLYIQNGKKIIVK